MEKHSDDPTHCHVYWISSKPMAKRTLDKDGKILDKIRRNELPLVEIKAAGDVAFCQGGKHESRNPYLPIGTTELCIIEELGDHIHSICRKYNLPVSDSERNQLRSLTSISNGKKSKSKDKQSSLLSDDLDNKRWTKIYESSRNNTLFDRARKYLRF